MKAAVAALALLLAAIILLRGAAEIVAEGRPALALTLWPGLESARRARTVDLLKAGQNDAAVRAARQAIERDPLDLSAMTGLALALDRGGEPRAARPLLTWVAGRSWRETAAHLWLLRDRLLAGNLNAGLGDADSLMRRDIPANLKGAVRLALVEEAAEPDNRAVLAGRLASAPPWRPALLESAAHDNPHLALALLQDLRNGPAPATASEAAPLVNRLTAEGRFGDGLAAWRLAARPPGESAALDRDGRFLAQPDGTAFTWTAEDGAGAAADRVSADGVGGRALRVEYDGYSLPTLPQQMLVLAPGAYRLSWRERPELGPPRIAWKVRCASDGRVIATSTGVDSPGPWRQASLDFTVPPAACEEQWLQLAPAPGERRIECVRWYADVRVAPLAAAPPRLD